MQKPVICKNCINFMIYDENTCICDYEYWEETSLLNAILYVPEMFECINFEYSIEIQEDMDKND